jgi:hypothetical protein
MRKTAQIYKKPEPSAFMFGQARGAMHTKTYVSDDATPPNVNDGGSIRIMIPVLQG